MSTYKTAVQVSSDVHQYLFNAKKRPGESFDSVLRRELGMPTSESDPEESEN